MNLTELKERLDNLYDDLTVTNEEARLVLDMMKNGHEDKRKLIEDMYFKENAPLKVINMGAQPVGQGDITGEMLELSMRYDDYLVKMEKRIDNILRKHEEAVQLFFCLLSLEFPYSQILYLRYFKRLPCQEVWDLIHSSRTAYFRNHKKAMLILLQKMNSHELPDKGTIS